MVSLLPYQSYLAAEACVLIPAAYVCKGGHNPSALDFLADVANSAGNHVAGEASRGTAAAAMSAGTQPINGILKVLRSPSPFASPCCPPPCAPLAAPSLLLHSFLPLTLSCCILLPNCIALSCCTMMSCCSAQQSCAQQERCLRTQKSQDSGVSGLRKAPYYAHTTMQGCYKHTGHTYPVMHSCRHS